MIGEFLESWTLFADTYIAGWLIAVLLAMVGVIVVARDQVFIGAAVAQASTLGIAIALVIGSALTATMFPDHEPHAPHSADEVDVAAAFEHGLPTVMAVIFAVLASLLTMRRPGPGRDSQEALTGWVFLLAGAAAILVVARSPHGAEEVNRLLASSLIGATPLDVWMFAAAALLTAGVLVACHRRIVLIIMDAETAAALGVRAGAWNIAMAVWLGLVLGLALHVAGLLYVFGCLVLPAVLARNLCRRVIPMFFVAPALALLIAVAGFILAHHFDYPFAQAVVALMGGLLPAAWVVRRMRN